MNIVYISPECFPFAKATSLADIVSKLSKSVEKEGHNVKLLIPRYGSVDPLIYQIERIPADFKVTVNGNTVLASVYKGVIPDSLVSVFFIESQNYFSNSKEIYLSSNLDEERFRFFSFASLTVMSQLTFQADIIHLFNHHTIDIANIIRSRGFEGRDFFKDNRIVFTLNNVSGLKENSIKKNILGGINNSDFITVPSKTFMEDLLNETQKYGLSEALSLKKDCFKGILLPLDDAYNPEGDKSIAQSYSSSYFSIGKKKCKDELFELLNLESSSQMPVFCSVSRFSHDNGTDILIEALHEISNMNVNFIVVGKGEPKYEQELTKIGGKYKNIKVCIGYDYEFSKKVFSGCDFFVSPERECLNGANILCAMNYGCIPVTYNTGTVKEIILNVNANAKDGNGIIFNSLDKDSLIEAINNSVKLYKNKEKWPSIVKSAMNFNSSLKDSVSEYIKCYEKVLSSTASVPTAALPANLYQ